MKLSEFLFPFLCRTPSLLTSSLASLMYDGTTHEKSMTDLPTARLSIFTSLIDLYQCFIIRSIVASLFFSAVFTAPAHTSMNSLKECFLHFLPRHSTRFPSYPHLFFFRLGKAEVH